MRALIFRIANRIKRQGKRHGLFSHCSMLSIQQVGPAFEKEIRPMHGVTAIRIDN